MDSLTLFFQNFFGIVGIPFKTITTSESSVSLFGTTTSLTAADCLTDGIKQMTDEDGSTLAGSTSVVSATATVLTYLQTFDPDYKDINLTQAYIESLDENQLNELIVNLDEKSESLKLTEEEAVLSKRI